MVAEVSIIIPVLNAEKTINRCLSSIHEQKFGNFHVIIVDDGSHDGSLEIARTWAKRDCRYTVIRNMTNTHGASQARNIGLSKVKTSYVTFIDSDDWVEPYHLNYLVQGMIENDICAVPWTHKNESLHLGRIKMKQLSREQCMIKALGEKNFSGYSCNKMFKMSIINKYKLVFNIDLHMSEDLAFVLQYIGYCQGGILILGPASYHYIEPNNSVVNNEANLKTGDLFMELTSLKYIESFICSTPGITRAFKVHMAMAYNTLLKKVYRSGERDRYFKLIRILRIKLMKSFPEYLFSPNLKANGKLSITLSIISPKMALSLKRIRS